ncbi:MAG: response regulator transcription factor [Magnetococcus sp. YQC-3]
MIRAFVVDDHEVVREGIKKLLLLDGDVQWVGDAANGRQAIKFILEHDLDVVLLDITLPDLDGLEVLSRLRQEKPALPVLIFTMHEADALALRYLKAGASGYVTKGSPSQVLLDALRTVVAGEKYLTPEIGKLLLREWSNDQGKPLHASLSNREFSVFRLLASGKSVGDIADELCLSIPTISTYRRRILVKLSMKNNAELISYAIRNNLVK